MHELGGTKLELAAARRDVELAKRDLSTGIRAASLVGARVADRVAASAKPLLVVLVGVGALALVVGLYGLTRGRRSRNGWRSPPRRSLLGEMVRAALVSSSARLASAAVARVQVGQLEAGKPEQSAAPQ